MEDKLVSPKLDIVFKKLFSENIDILKEFISDILDIPRNEISDITVLNPEISPESVGEKYYRLDLILRVGQKLVNVEMQVKSEDYFQDRTLLYWAKMYSSQLKSGREYDELCPCIAVNIVDFEIFPEYNDYHSEYGVWDIEHKNRLTDKMAIHFFELKKVSAQLDPNNRKALWLQFIKADKKEDFEMLEKTNVPVIQKGVQVVYNMSNDEKTKELVRMREKALHDKASELGEARRKGQSEKEAEIIQKMRAKGMTDEQINDILYG